MNNFFDKLNFSFELFDRKICYVNMRELKGIEYCRLPGILHILHFSRNGCNKPNLGLQNG